jgi:hypothetical protein
LPDTELKKLVDGLQDSVIPATLAAGGEEIYL